MKNTDKYSEHFLMNKETVKEYCKEYLDFFDDEELDAQEIGDGNINYVFKVTGKKTGKSIVIKQADKFLRSSGRALDLYRNKIEAEILGIEGQLAPNYVPEIYNYNEEMFALSMEDISSFKNLRKELMSGMKFDHLSEDISTFLAKTLLPTTDLVLDRHEKKEKVRLFTNIELCDISEDLVFTEPYYNYKDRNIITKGNEEFVKKYLYNDEELKAEVGYLRNNFMNNTQALVHGDLHSGSIFINEKGLKVIDPEFAFYGPMGYDIGNVIGNLFFSLVNRKCVGPENKDFINWIEKTIIDIFDKTMQKLSEEYDELVKFPLYNHIFKKEYLKSIMSDSIGYAGTEIVRRTVGDSKVAEVSSVENSDIRIKLDRILVLTGINLIKKRALVNNGEELMKVFEEAIEQYGNEQ
ncbi:MAG: S-methyl-5-thioribose kinase [Coprobacillus sp.]